MREGVEHDRVGMQLRKTRRGEQVAKRQHPERSLDSMRGGVSDPCESLERRAVKEPLVAIELVGGEPAPARIFHGEWGRGRRLETRLAEHDDALNVGFIAGFSPSGRAEVANRAKHFRRIRQLTPGGNLERDRLVFISDPSIRLHATKRHDRLTGNERSQPPEPEVRP